MGVATVLYYGTIIIVYMDEIKSKMNNKYLLVARTIASIVVYPFYFLLHGVAMWIAVYEIFKKPFFWHKTKHGGVSVL